MTDSNHRSIDMMECELQLTCDLRDIWRRSARKTWAWSTVAIALIAILFPLTWTNAAVAVVLCIVPVFASTKALLLHRKTRQQRHELEQRTLAVEDLIRQLHAGGPQ